jgi:D-amino-acid dehydrogenase
MSKHVIIIGGGIIGLSSAFYLRQEGYEVTVIDKSTMREGCSYGNAGYICPSHFVPMATPGIVKQGLKWMLNSKSPFYIQPRLNSGLIDWGFKFIKSANSRHVEASAKPLRDIAVLSKQLYEEWARTPGFDFSYNPIGMLEFFRTEENAHHAEASVKDANALGLEAKVLNKQEVQAMQPGTNIDILGAVYYGCDAQVYPNKLMSDLIDWLQKNGVKLETNQEVTSFVMEDGRVKTVNTATGSFTADHVVLAAGVWSREIAQQLHLKLPMVGGRGYSVTFDDAPYDIKYPVILSEARVAISPLNGNKLRFGGTMEITNINEPPRMNRVKGILESVKIYFPDYDIPMPAENKVWYGYRPCSADGLPYLGNAGRYKNVTIATGHSMLGLSLGAATGKLVSELVAGKATSMDVQAFDANRYN